MILNTDTSPFGLRFYGDDVSQQRGCYALFNFDRALLFLSTILEFYHQNRTWVSLEGTLRIRLPPEDFQDMCEDLLLIVDYGFSV